MENTSENPIEDVENLSVPATASPAEPMDTQTNDGLIKKVGIAFVLYALYLLYHKTSLIYVELLGLAHHFFEVDSLALDFLWALVVPVSAWLFWKRKKAGWIILALYFTYEFISTGKSVIILLSIPSIPAFFKGFIVHDIISDLVFLAGIVLLCLRSIRRAFSVSEWLIYAIFVVFPVIWILYGFYQFLTSLATS